MRIIDKFEIKLIWIANMYRRVWKYVRHLKKAAFSYKEFSEMRRSWRRSWLPTEQLAWLRHCAAAETLLLRYCPGVSKRCLCITKSRRTRCTDCPIRISRN